uniref:Uncharacterized protein n=1 Tax=Leersia perrieri TaxID=77586 RepID=A0A0D9XD27_9ORYZ
MASRGFFRFFPWTGTAGKWPRRGRLLLGWFCMEYTLLLFTGKRWPERRSPPTQILLLCIDLIRIYPRQIKPSGRVYSYYNEAKLA